MLARIAQDGTVLKYPYTRADAMADFPGTGFSEGVWENGDPAFGLVAVVDNPRPNTQPGHVAEESAPVMDSNGVWTRNWSVRQATDDELDAKRRAVWTRAKAKRDAVVVAGVNVPGIGRFDSDDASRANLSGAVLGAFMAKTAGEPFSIDWKLADNTVATLTADQMIAVGKAVLKRTADAHKRAQQMANALANANFAALDNFDINGGWPA